MSLTVGLCGEDGIGKTTLLTQLKNKFIKEGYVSTTTLLLFVVVKYEEEVEGIQDEIGKRLGIYLGGKDKEEKAVEVYEFLKVKRFVLLLDGLPKKLELEEIGIPLPSRENGCKIVFTSSRPESCRSKWADAQFRVISFTAQETWEFFQQIVGETTLKSHPDIPRLARTVCTKCRGLPIAVSLVGETMSRKRTAREWHHAIHGLVSSAAQFSDTEDELLPILKFTYDNLPGENIKSCFLYCALFPRSCDVNKQDLVDCWIAEGIIEEDREVAEIRGYELMGDLISMILLVENESGNGVTMHNMVREMALRSGRQKENFVVVSGKDIHEMPEVNDWRVVRRLSVTSTQIENISDDSQNCSELTTLFLQGNSHLKWVSGDFLRWMTNLAVLNLSRNRQLSELPEEVSTLVSLRLLNLSWTWIKRLPLSLKKLKRLIHLDLDETHRLREIDVIGCLLNLQVLRLFRSVPMDLSLVEDLQLLKSLKELNLTVREVDVLKRLLSIHQLASCIRLLNLTGITINDGGTLPLNSMMSLRELNIGMSDISEITINWRSTIQREMVHFGNIPHLQNIRTVALFWCKGLRDLTWLLLAPNLGDLRILECQQIEQIINKEKATADMIEQPFQNLTSLSLDSLPQLESIYWTPLPFPVLKYVFIRGCPKLTRHSFSSKENKVRLDVGRKGVEREGEATKQHLSDYDDRDIPKMPEEQKVDGLGSESQPNEEIVLVETLESGKGTTTNSITGEVQSGKHATVEQTTQTNRKLTPDGMISDMIDNPEPMGGEVVTELVKQLFAVSRKTLSCRGVAKNLATMIEGVQPAIKEIFYSGTEVSPHHQVQLRMYSETIDKCRKLTDKVLKCHRWNFARQLYHAKKMEDLDKKISCFIRGLPLHVLAEVHHLRANAEVHYLRTDAGGCLD